MNTEISGHKFEIEEQVAVRIETLHIGDRVSVLYKPSYGDKKVFPGVIVGFEPFPTLPTVLVAYMEEEWSSAKIKVAAFNAETKDMEMVRAMTSASPIDKENAIKMFQSRIDKARREVMDAENQLSYFERNFAAYWQPIEA